MHSKLTIIIIYARILISSRLPAVRKHTLGSSKGIPVMGMPLQFYDHNYSNLNIRNTRKSVRKR